MYVMSLFEAKLFGKDFDAHLFDGVGDSSRRSYLVKIALVVPVCNEEKFIESTIDSLEDYLVSFENYDISILIAEDGSTDNTLKGMNQLASKYGNILLRHDPRKLGRARAVKNAWKGISADIYIYIDADLPVDIRYLNVLIESCNNGIDLVTGSRYLKNSDVKRPLMRKIVSKCYNLLINILFKTSVKDHQCGFKAVSRKCCNFILEESIFDDWFWDTELFVIAKRNNLSVYEFPVTWEERRMTRTPLKRLLKDIGIHSRGIVKLLKNELYLSCLEISSGLKLKFSNS